MLAESLIAAEHEDERAFERLRTIMLEEERRPEVAAALLSARWQDLLEQLIAQLHPGSPGETEDER